MDQCPFKLTLVYPQRAEDRIVEFMLESTPKIEGFTTLRAEGHGHDFTTASVSERVRGRVARGMLIAIMTKDRADALLAELQEKAPLPHMAYWLEPIRSFGRMAPSAKTSNAGNQPSPARNDRHTVAETGAS